MWSLPIHEYNDPVTSGQTKVEFGYVSKQITPRVRPIVTWFKLLTSAVCATEPATTARLPLHSSA